MNTITRRDMTDFVTRNLDASGFPLTDWDIEAIVDELHSTYGLVDLETIDDAAFYAVIEKHTN